MLPIVQKSYHKLIVYQKAKHLVVLVYLLTRNFPEEEKYSLVPQLRRCVISIVANLVEGYSKNSKKDFARFIGISIGSASELSLYLDLSCELKYLSSQDFKEVSETLLEVKKMLYSFQKTLRAKV